MRGVKAMLALRCEGRFLKSYEPEFTDSPDEALLFEDAPCTRYQAVLGGGTYSLEFVPVRRTNGGKVVTL